MGLLAAQQTQGRVHRTQDSVWVGVRGQGCLEPGVPDSELWAPWLPRLRALPGSRPGDLLRTLLSTWALPPSSPILQGRTGGRGAGLEVKVGWVGEQGWRLLQSGLTLRPALSPLPGPQAPQLWVPSSLYLGLASAGAGSRLPPQLGGVLGAKTGPDLP